MSSQWHHENEGVQKYAEALTVSLGGTRPGFRVDESLRLTD
jgi:hypothetical protein